MIAVVHDDDGWWSLFSLAFTSFCHNEVLPAIRYLTSLFLSLNSFPSTLFPPFSPPSLPPILCQQAAQACRRCGRRRVAGGGGGFIFIFHLPLHQ
jgi:hypothetical protein